MPAKSQTEVIDANPDMTLGDDKQRRVAKRIKKIRVQVERIVESVMPGVEIVGDGDAGMRGGRATPNATPGTIVISEWQDDCGAPYWVIPMVRAIEFAGWMRTQRIAQWEMFDREAKARTSPAERKRIRAAYRKWKAENPYAPKKAA